MWQSIIPKAPEDISVEEFFTKFVPNQFNQMNALFSLIDFSFLTGRDFKMQFDVEGRVYSVTFKNGKDLDVTEGSIDKPNFTLIVSEKDWRDAVTGKFNELADDFTGDPISFLNARHYKALMAMTGTVNMNLKKQDGVNIPLSLIFNGEEKPAVTVNLDMLDALRMMNKSVSGPVLFMNGKLKFTGNMVLLMKLQNLI
jgi:putative sterol carrier protein